MVAAGMAGVLALLAWLPMNSSISLPGSSCLFHSATGLPCALCGGTRATKAILHGDFQRALHLNAAAFPFIAAMVVAIVILGWECLRGRAMTHWGNLARRYRLIFPITLILLVIWWIPQMVGALSGRQSELIDLRNPIARALADRFQHRSP